MARRSSMQNYRRLDNDLMDESALKPHGEQKIALEDLKRIVRGAIESANRKSSRAILNIPEDSSHEETIAKYRASGKDLFDYFVRYCGDPAETAYQCTGRRYADVAREQFHNRTLQKERMNSGWRYQYIAKDAAIISGRFASVSDLGTQEADFNVSLSYNDNSDSLSIYVSVKNRTNTMGGQDWPKAIAAIESVASTDKNRTSSYLCVFGIAMERGDRLIKRNQKTGTPHGPNTEVWKSDFFWPFFTNYSYEEIIRVVLDTLRELQPEVVETPVPDELIEAFGQECRDKNLLDEDERFDDPYKLVRLFCGGSEE